MGDSWAGVDHSTRQSSIARWFNTTAFAFNDIGTVGNLGRNTMFTPGNFNTDMSLLKDFPISEKYGQTQL